MVPQSKQSLLACSLDPDTIMAVLSHAESTVSFNDTVGWAQGQTRVDLVL